MDAHRRRHDLQPLRVGTAAADADAVATSFASSANGLSRYTAFAVGSTLYIVSIDGDTFAVSATIARSTAAGIDATVSGTIQTTWSQRIHFVPRGEVPVEAGDRWTVRVGTTDYF